MFLVFHNFFLYKVGPDKLLYPRGWQTIVQRPNQVFVCKEKVLLEHSPALHFRFAHGIFHITMAQLSSNRNNMTGKPENIYHLALYKKSVVTLLFRLYLLHLQ